MNRGEFGMRFLCLIGLLSASSAMARADAASATSPGTPVLIHGDHEAASP